ncbi:NADH-quinone oxidoreductase subunit L [Candidatus Thiodictyon syntrophicum]|jgi:NAD(P)H-quinone oxidoreductase subunit 5|uniref:Probable inorganic carbon transporter subunit DabB n=1 Tax=Candidatus Thiodictyon syntrophicum TaxID=1166950 RepID=A0A2K8UHH1_9GAMM|nr:NADH-quinone oxidoreductase subunit L [Candidatus Thiodictyon syntrophicum]AUB85034.1 NADH dehydrogenase FAD-containing subunit [Candidatus Thiodictyon syntrophicum]
MLPDGPTHGLVLAAPLLLLSVGLVPAAWANAWPGLMARLCGAAAWLAFVSALLAAVAYPFEGTYAWIFYRVELPGGLGALTLGTYVNSVTVIMLMLVAFIGAIVTRYAYNYLDGDPNRGRFNKWLALTLAAILTLIVSGNLLMFALAWIATSLCLHQLLMFYPERPAAVLAAHKKFVASRVGDLSLLVAVALIGLTLHTLQFDELFRILAAMEGPVPIALEIAALLIVIAAVLKSAQFPFHGWLLQVMEAPTPVSALLHAGIVNAGAFLVIRMSPVMSHSQLAMGVLAVIGLFTLALASLVMLTQTNIKVSLAWSTTAQMGFMLLECGLGLYSLAMLHLVAHSLYKAHAFLASGSGVDAFRAPVLPHASPGVGPVQLLPALAGGGLIVLAVGAAFGVTAGHQPAHLAAGTVVVIAVTQLLLQMAGVMRGEDFLRRGLALSAVVAVAYFTLHALFDAALQGSVLPVQDADGPFQVWLAQAFVGVFLVLLVFQQVLKQAPAFLGDGIYMHLYNGLYIDVYITRLIERIWPGPLPAPGTPPAPFAPVTSPGA